MPFIQSVTAKVLERTKRHKISEQSQECIVSITETSTRNH